MRTGYLGSHKTSNVVFEEEESDEGRGDRDYSRPPSRSLTPDFKHGGKVTQANSIITDEKPKKNRSVVDNTAGHGDPTSDKTAALLAEMRSPLGKQAATKLLEEYVYPGLPDGQLIEGGKLPHACRVYEDGCYYGGLKYRLPEGYGLFWFLTGDMYVGTWANGMPSGHGYYYLAEGGFFFGTVEKGYANGHGTYYRKQDKLYYQGTFDAGFMEGKGFLSFKGEGHDCVTKNNSIVFAKKRPVQSVRRVQLPLKIATFEEELSFVSLMTNPETGILARHSVPEWESTYVGETNDQGQKHGVGSLLFSNGSRYHGMFVEDRILGIGVAVDQSGNVRMGFFDHGGMHLFGHSCTDADLYSGCYFHGSYDGPAFYYNNSIGRWILAYFSVGDIICKAYTGNGKLSLPHIALSRELIALMVQKAFTVYESTSDCLGTPVLAGRNLPESKITTDAALQISVENTYFRKLVKQYILGTEVSRRKRFDGKAWEKKCKSPVPSMVDYSRHVFERYGPMDIQTTEPGNPRPQRRHSKDQPAEGDDRRTPNFTKLELPSLPSIKNPSQPNVGSQLTVQRSQSQAKYDATNHPSARSEQPGNFSFREFGRPPTESMVNNPAQSSAQPSTSSANREQLSEVFPNQAHDRPAIPNRLNLSAIPMSQANFDGSSNSQRSSRRDLPSSLKKPNFDFLTKV